MKCNKVFFLPSLFILIVIFLSSPLNAEPIPVDEIVNRAMDKTLLEMKNPWIKVIKQGSWISKDNYREIFKRDAGELVPDKFGNLIASANPSDCDARLFIPFQKVSDDVVKGVWLEFREKLGKNLESMAKKAGYSSFDIQNIRKAVNFYPPEQLIKGITTRAEALEFFNNMGTYPSLLEAGEEGADGMFARNTQFLRQKYEKGARVRVCQLVADESGSGWRLERKLTAVKEHAIEGVAKKNVKGFANAAELAIHDANKAAKAGNPDLAIKNIDRAGDYLTNARKLTNANTSSKLIKDLEALEKQYDDLIEKTFLSGSGVDADSFIKTSREISEKINREIIPESMVDFNALKNLAKQTNTKKRHLLKGILDGKGKYKELRIKLISLSDDAWKKGLSKELGIWFGTTLLDFWSLKQLDESIKKGEVGPSNIVIPAFLNYLFPPTTAFGKAILCTEIYVVLVSIAIQEIETSGYAAVINQQDCMDLIAGIYTLEGRAHRILENKCEEIQDGRGLACRVYDHHQLRRKLLNGDSFDPELIPPLLIQILNCHANNASKHYEHLESKHDIRIAQALINKCTAPVLNEWLEFRQIIVNEMDFLKQSLQEGELELSVTPPNPTKKSSVSIEAKDTYSNNIENEIRARIKCLGGIHAKPKFLRYYVWKVNGKEFAATDKNKTKLRINEAGIYDICVDVSYRWSDAGPSQDFGIYEEARKSGCIKIVVPDEDAKTGTEDQAATTQQDDNTQKQPATPGKEKPGAWVLVKEIPELKLHGKTNMYISGTISPSSGSIKSVQKRQHHQTLERAVHRSTMSWNPPPTVLIPGQKIKLNLKVSVKGTAGKDGNMIYGDGTYMYTAVDYYRKKDHKRIGGRGTLTYTKAEAWIGGKKLQNSGSKNTEWQVAPGRGEGVQLYLGYGGGATAGSGWYRYVYEFKADYHPGDEPKKVPPRNRLQVKLTASPERPSFLGDTVEVTAEASGGKTPYVSYNWSGDHAGKGEKVLFASRKAGDHQLSVTVTDAKGQTATASITIKVQALKVTIRKVSPVGSSVVLGTPVRFSANIEGGDKNKLEMLWEPNTEVDFDPFENSLKTTAIFPSPGTHKVWLVVYRVEGEERITVGESQQLELEVVKPGLTLTRVSPAPRIGDEVKLRVDAGPDTDPKKIAFWWEIAGNTFHAGALRDNREYTFKPKDSKPVTVTVHAKAKDGGEDLGEESLTITASSYTVTVSKPKRLGPPVRIWKQGEGLVRVEKEIAIHQNVLLKAGISPAPKNKPLRYQWTLNEDSHFAGGSTGSEVTVNRSQTGACVATVTIKDKYGNVLGSGSSTFQVTISQQQLDTALNRDKDQKQAKKLLQQARTQWSNGDLDKAIATLREAKKLDPDNQEIVKTLKSMERRKEKLESKPGSQDRFESIGRKDAPVSGQQGGSSERQRKPPKGHSTKYGF